MNDLEKFVEEMKNIFGNSLKSVILYGSKASGEDTKEHSDHNILLILDNIRFEDMRASNKAMDSWTKQGNPPPLLFTYPMFTESADVFPIEFQDIKDHYKVLYGEDPVANLRIEDTNLRHELEFELKGKLLKLRQGYMMFSNKSAKLKDLMIGSISSFLILLKHSIKLLGGKPPKKKLDALEVLSEKTGLNKKVFLDIINMKNGDKAALSADMDRTMIEYMQEIEKIVAVVNNL
ncbi:MAG: hypothetical protein LHV68_04315 [Elusimicrobia bacterium]|nr:hypothetical protein [Candidatus Liberimonas magnetica]